MASIFGTNDPEFLPGGDSGDDIHGLGGDDVLYGLGGNDTLDGGAGGDYLHGGAGDDFVDYRNTTGVWVDLGKGTAAGGEAFGDTLVSIEGVLGSDQQDLIIGAGWREVLHGRGGNDVLQGMDWNDILVGGAGGDVLDGGSGIDYVDYERSSAIWIDLAKNTAAGGEAFGDSFSEIEGVWGSNEGDLISGADGLNTFTGRDGNDVLEGRGGEDSLYADNGDDILDGGEGNDYLFGGAGADRFDGGAGFDSARYFKSSVGLVISLVNGGQGGEAEGDIFVSVESVIGTAFADTISGNGLNNNIDGYSGFDKINGGGGNDTVSGGGMLSGDVGDDTLRLTLADAGGLFGGPGNDSLRGSSNRDTVSGGVGADTLDGAGGADTMTGGGDADLFKYHSLFDSRPGAANQDVIQDLSRTDGDRISFAAIDPIPGAPDNALKFIGAQAFNGVDGELRFVSLVNQSATFLQVDADGDKAADMQIRCAGIIAFAQGDFIL